MIVNLRRRERYCRAKNIPFDIEDYQNRNPEAVDLSSDVIDVPVVQQFPGMARFHPGQEREEISPPSYEQFEQEEEEPPSYFEAVERRNEDLVNRGYQDEN